MNLSRKLAVRLRARRQHHRRILLETLELRACPATFIVNSTLDSVDASLGDGLAEDATGRTTLRAAVMEANALAGNDTINLPGGTYALTITNPPGFPIEDGSTSGDLDILNGVITFFGAGRDQTIIDASAVGDRVLETIGSGSFGLFDLTIRGGTAVVGSIAGGAIVNRGRSTMSNVAIVNNHAVHVGGGIFNDGINASLTISSSLLSGNVSDQGGGAIANFNGSVSIFSTTLGSNRGVLDGGAVLTHFGSFSAQDSLFVDNQVTAQNSGGGAISSRTFRLQVATSSFERNRAAFGGAILAYDKVTLTRSTFAANEATIDGGAANLPASPINLAHEFINNTFSGNRAGRVAGALITDAWTTFRNNTVTGNQALLGTGGVDNDFGHAGSRFQNNIIARNTGPTFSPDVQGTFVSDGGNLIGDGSGVVGFTQSDDQVGTLAVPVDPRLGPLGNNGGPTQTHTLLAGSPAIDGGRNTGAPTTDQRGFPRPVNAIVDIGAVEIQGLGNISGLKWNDVDGDGMRDSGEPGLSGWTIFLDQNKNRVLDAGETSTVTGPNGAYLFTDLPAGDYFLAEVPQNGWVPTFPAQTGNAHVFVSGGTNIITHDGGQLVRTAFSGGALTTIATNVFAPFGVDDVGADLYYRHGSVPGTTLRAELDGSSPQPFLTGWGPGTYEFDTPNNRFFFSIGRDLYRASMASPSPVTIMPGLNGISDIEYDPVTDSVFTANANALVTGDNLWSFKADGSGGTQLIGGLTDIQGLAVDRVNRRIYFSDTIGGSAFIRAIYTADMDGSNVRLLVDTRVFGLSRPSDIEVIPELNAIFWIDTELRGLYRAELSGANPVRIADLAFQPEQLEVSAPYYTTTVIDGQVVANRDFGNRLLELGNQPPVANNQSATTDEDVALNGALTATDPDGDLFSFAVVAGPAHGTLSLSATTGAFTYIPTANYNGPDSFTFKVNDGQVDSNTATVSLVVLPVNDAPTANGVAAATDEDTAVSGQLDAADIDGNPLTYLVVAGPAHGTVTVNASGAFTYTPAANYNGPDSFTFKANDGSADSNIATVSLTILPVNDAPTASGAAVATDEDTAVSGQLSAADIEGNSLTYILVTGPAHGTVAVNATGAFTYTPAANYNGPDSFTFKANDGQVDSNTATVSLIALPVNDAPTAADASLATDEDTAVSGQFVAADIDGNPLTYSVASGPAHGTLSVNATTGAFTYTPAANYNGPDSFTFKANDGFADSNVATVSLTVRPVNDAPTANGAAVATDEDTAVSGQLDAADIDGNPLTYALVAGPAHGTLSVNATTGAFTYTPAANYNGPDSFTFKANDGSADSNIAAVSLTVRPVNDAPIASDARFSIAENSPATTFVGQVQASDVDAGQSHTFAIVGGNTLGAFAIDASGRITVATSAALDFESRPQFVLSVLVTDSASPSLSDMAEVIVDLIDVAEPSLAIDILPQQQINTINMNSGGKVPVAIISSAIFDAPSALDVSSLRFGRTGTEAAPLRSPSPKKQDVNGDGRADLLVYFEIGATGFLPGDVWGVLSGRTRAGAAMEGRDRVDLKFPGHSAGTSSPTSAGVDALMQGEGESAAQSPPGITTSRIPLTPASTSKKKQETLAPAPQPKPVAAPLSLYRRQYSRWRRR